MDPGLVLVFWAFMLIEVKHFAFDFLIREGGREPGGIYVDRQRIIHAVTHGLGSISALVLLTNSALLITTIVIAEVIAHFHFDWLKARITARLGLDYSNRLFWILFGGDQFAHQLTYVVMLAVLVSVASP